MGTPFNPGWPTGYIPSAAEWDANWSGKVDYPAPVDQGGSGATNSLGAARNILQRKLISASPTALSPVTSYGAQTSLSAFALSLPALATVSPGDWIDLADVDFNATNNPITITANGTEQIAFNGVSGGSQMLNVSGIQATLIANATSWTLFTPYNANPTFKSVDATNLALSPPQFGSLIGSLGSGIAYFLTNRVGGYGQYGNVLINSQVSASLFRSGEFDSNITAWISAQHMDATGVQLFGSWFGANTPNIGNGAHTYSGGAVVGQEINVGNRWADFGLQADVGGTRYTVGQQLVPDVVPAYNEAGVVTTFPGTFGLAIAPSVHGHKWWTGHLTSINSIVAGGRARNTRGGSVIGNAPLQLEHVDGYWVAGTDYRDGIFSAFAIGLRDGQNAAWYDGSGLRSATLGTDTSGDLAYNRYDATGAYADTPISVSRTTGLIYLPNRVRGQGTTSGVVKTGWPSTNSPSSNAFSYLDDAGIVAGGAVFNNIASSGYARTSDTFGTATEVAMVYGGFVYNDKQWVGAIGPNGNGSGAGPSQTPAWVFYGTAFQAAVANAGLGTYASELDIANAGTTISAFPANPNPAGLTAALRLGSGGEATATLGLVKTATEAIGIIANDFAATDANFNASVPYACFDKGLVFDRFSIAGTNGKSGSGVAVAYSTGHFETWYDPNNLIVGTIGAEVSASNTAWMNILFNSGGVVFSKGLDNSVQFQIGPVPGAVNFLLTQAAVTTGAPHLIAAGSDTNIDLFIQPKGTGVLGITYAMAAATTPTSFSATNILKIKDGTGTTYYVAAKTAAW